jgi:hypothetical protein
MKRICTYVLLCSLYILNTTQITKAQTSYTEVTSQVGFAHLFGAVVEFGAGVSFCDFNNDGIDDLTFSTVPGDPIHFLQNNSGTFSSVSPVSTVIDTFESKQMLFADIDNDGDEDLFVVNHKYPNQLFRNDGGQYNEVTAAYGLDLLDSPTYTACWGDYDRDGYLDLFVANRPELNYPGRNYLYKNVNGTSFTETTIAAGVTDSLHMPLACAFLDYNNDMWPDLYIVSDKMAGNQIYKNNGDGTFTDASVSTGLGVVMCAMGIAQGDYDNDGDLDLYISNMQDTGNFFFRNNGNETFSQISTSLGVENFRVCWGTNFFDYDNDGWQDIFVCASDWPNAQLNLKNTLYQNTGSGFLETTGNDFDDDTLSDSFGTAIGDYNNDGHYDIAVSNRNDSSQLFMNTGGTNNWIKLKLEGVQSNRNGVGSWIRIVSGGTEQVRYKECGISFCSQNSGNTIIGLGTNTLIDTIEISWPSGWVDVMTSVTVNQFLLLQEGFSTVSTHNAPELSTSLLAYPNPTTNSTTLTISASNSGQYELEVYDAIGRKTHSESIYIQNRTTQIEIQSNTISTGLNYIQLRSKEQTLSTTLLKQ